MMLLTLFVYLYRTLSDSASGIYSSMSEVEITEFNQQFLNYDYTVTGSSISTQDVATIINLVQTSYDTKAISIELTIGVSGYGTISLTDSGIYEKWLNENLSSTDTYRCDVTVSGDELLVSNIKITKITT